MIIYKATNKINNKIYIGQTVGNLDRRVAQHLVSNKKNKLDFLEKFYINFFNSKVPNGYNLTDGGEGLSNPSDEVRIKLKEANKGKVLSEDQKIKIGKSNEKPKSESHRINLSKAHIGHIPWNKGLTKEIDSRIISGPRKEGYSAWNKGLNKEIDIRLKEAGGKISKAKKGWNPSNIIRENMSRGQLKRWAKCL